MIVEAGLNFDITGTLKFRKHNIENGQLKETTSPDEDKNRISIILGHDKNAEKKVKNGFTIDYNQSKDTPYTDYQGNHAIKMIEQYHAQIFRINKK